MVSIRIAARRARTFATLEEAKAYAQAAFPGATFDPPRPNDARDMGDVRSEGKLVGTMWKRD